MPNVDPRRWPSAAAVPIAALAAGAVILSFGQSRDLPLSARFEVDSKARVVTLTRSAPERCVFTAPGTELCTWKVEASLFEPGVVPEASSALGVNLVCELPLDVTATSGGACEAHLRSQRPLLATLELPDVSAGPEIPEPGWPAERAAELLADAATLPALSALLGDVPDTCRTGLGFQSCLWQLGEESPGHPLVAALAGIEGPAELRCALPLDGSPRAPESCRIEDPAQ